jgi:Ca2+/Na+ antiporter
VFDYDKHTDHHHWHHGGLVNRPVYFDQIGEEVGEGLAKPLLNDGKSQSGSKEDWKSSMSAAANTMELNDAPWEVIPLEDVLYCEPPPDKNHLVFTLHMHQHNDDLGNLITLEIHAKDPAVLDSWVAALMTQLKAQRRQVTDHAPDDVRYEDWQHLLHEWAEWVQFPVKFFAKLTIPDMDHPASQGWYPVSFCMCMVWLAMFAFAVIQACTGIHDDFGISEDLLGFTVAAAGTSFPNVFSGMLVAKQGKTSMAVANALGANIQNVFLALAVPWTINTCFILRGTYVIEVSDLQASIVECGITLMPVVLIYFCCKHTLPRWSGYLMLFTYVAYLIIALGQQNSGCVYWPLRCGHDV